MRGILGEVTITEENTITGASETITEDNVVLDVGIGGLWNRIGGIDPSQSYQINTIYLGDDMGDNGTIFNPDPPDKSFDGSEQNTTHMLDRDLLTFTYPVDSQLLITATINGEDFMNTNFPEDVEYRFTSLSVRYNNELPLAYKRFPIRSIARFVNVTISWRFTIFNEEDACD